MAEGTGKKVVLAMSGGVDSSVAAALLKQRGYEVIGCFMRLGTPAGVQEKEPDCKIDPTQPAKQKQGCCSVLDAGDARRVAQLLDIPFYVLNFQEDFGRVIDYFIGEYNRGRTPNPCVRCNDWLKFGRLAKYADAVGADFVASGHYARVGIDPVNGQKTLLRGLDHKKDQSYVLFGMPRSHVDRLMLPVGEFEKHEVRKIAEDLNLPVFNKPDSQEICFVPDQDYAGLINRRSPGALEPGELVTPGGEVVGKHGGHQNFTIGQRKGVGVALGYPIYVVDIDAGSNRVVLGDKEQLLRTQLVANQINVISDRVTSEPLKCEAKIRYNHAPQPATVRRTGADELTVVFAEPQSAVTPGQAVVCYDGDVVLAGGWIDKTA
ncbi:MAG: tRNA 2-thiouridine(34) synthase MnmA [Tepidisphaeraceae bacterium]